MNTPETPADDANAVAQLTALVANLTDTVKAQVEAQSASNAQIPHLTNLVQSLQAQISTPATSDAQNPPTGASQTLPHSIQGPHESLIQKVEDSVGKPAQAPIRYFDSAERPKEVRELWKDFINYGINLPVILLPLFKDTSDLQCQGPIIVSEMVSPPGTPATLRRSHPCRDGISIWRPIRNGVGPEHGLFRVYPRSRMIESEQELRESGIPALDIRIRADQVDHWLAYR
ncbi:uncharacterized protein CDV56_104182 [Aspergillus thermomutatus]|uniref:Uncharacterized protein n=1 Tax=Aspergillus thermomutatus TaxID=41047 RepID=A0A397G7Y0_ASPTH|nr:uncharacterized protein CDV56_104182 [Aspergillus thermomutatus]RHZ45043.1 hypothetical protein CDV56_104182 [Aspergillus thermomutatus]